jgi:hypothetical protein
MGVERVVPAVAEIVETVAKDVAESPNAVNLLDIVGGKLLGSAGWKTTKEAALRLGIMPDSVGSLARSGDLLAERVGAQWRIDPLSVDSRLGEQADSEAVRYARLIDRPFTGRSRALGLSAFRDGLKERQEQVARRLNLTAAGVGKEWNPPSPLKTFTDDQLLAQPVKR